MISDTALVPARIRPIPAEPRFQDRHRLWQGIPSIERTAGGRLLAVWYSGEDGEKAGNFVVMATSDDDAEYWTNRLIVVHDDPEIRVYDSTLWRDPSDRLWWIWSQSRGYFDGRVGAWVSTCDNPDADAEGLVWSEPRRIANGIMMNKPIVRHDGAWLFPTGLWSCHPPTEQHNLDDEVFSNVHISHDQGESFALLGSADVPNRSFDEHMLLERRDRSLWMLVRSFDGIGESVSIDGGRTWSPGRLSSIPGPCSRFHIRRLPSGRVLLVNHADFADPRPAEERTAPGARKWLGRTNLTAFLSEDDGRTWPYRLLLDAREEVAYPDVALGDDGEFFVIYDNDRYRDRGIYVVRTSEAEVLAGRGVDLTPRLVNRALGLQVEDSSRV